MSDTPKMIRETLCVAQTAVGLLPDDYQAGRTRDEHIAQLQRLHDAIVDVPESTHAREDVPWLVERVEALTAERDDLEAEKWLRARADRIEAGRDED